MSTPRISLLFAVPIALVATVPSSAPAQSLKRVAVFGITEPKEFGARMTLSPDGRYLAVSRQSRDKASLVVWDIAGKKQLATLEVDDRFGFTEPPAISSAPLRIAVSNLEPEGIKFWELDAKTGRLVPSERAVVLQLPFRGTFSADGKRLASTESGFTLIDVENRKLIHSFRPRINVWANAPSPDLRLVAASNFQDVDLYDAETGKERGSLLDHCGNVDTLAYRPDGKVLAVGACRSDSRFRKFVSEIKVWDVTQLKEIATTGEFPGRVACIVHPDERVLFALWSADLYSPGALKLYNVRTGAWTTARTFDSRISSVQVAVSPVGVVAVAREGIVEVSRIVPPE